MSAPNRKSYGADLARFFAPNNPEALKGNHLAQMRAKSRAIWRTNGAFPFRRAFRQASAGRVSHG